MAKQKVLNIQLGSFYDAEKKKQVPVSIPAYPKKNKDGSVRYVASLTIFVNEMEAKDEEAVEDAGI